MTSYVPPLGGAVQACSAALALALALGACTLQLQPSGPRAVEGDLAAISTGLATFERWLDATPPVADPPLGNGIFPAGVRPDEREPPPRRRAAVTVAPQIEIATGQERSDARLEAVFKALTFASLAPPRQSIAPPLPAPAKPSGPAARGWIPKPKPGPGRGHAAATADRGRG